MLMEGAGGSGMGSARKEATQSSRIQEEEPGYQEGGTGKLVLLEVGNADEKDENEVTDRLERMSSACERTGRKKKD